MWIACIAWKHWSKIGSQCNWDNSFPSGFDAPLVLGAIRQLMSGFMDAQATKYIEMFGGYRQSLQGESRINEDQVLFIPSDLKGTVCKANLGFLFTGAYGTTEP